MAKGTFILLILALVLVSAVCFLLVADVQAVVLGRAVKTTLMISSLGFNLRLIFDQTSALLSVEQNVLAEILPEVLIIDLWHLVVPLILLLIRFGGRTALVFAILML